MHSFLLVSLLASVTLAEAPSREASWVATGPPGGNVRSLVADPRSPQRIYLGTADGILYRSDDEGGRWQRMSPGFTRRGCSLDKLAVDSHGTLYVGFWEVGGAGGGLVRSRDGGKTFTTIKGVDREAVRALAIAPSDSRRIAAGTPTGVLLTRDGGKTWERITPKDHRDLKNIESLAFDTADPRTLYAGTRHLAWKTEDDGAHWQPIHAGMIDDSHVMTLNMGRESRNDIYATACTGIYHSADAGGKWRKLGGIPDSSRRTRAFSQSEEDPQLLLAGTTEGLWVSENAGSTWRLTTSKDLVINAVVLQRDGSILLGTEEEGVMHSADRGRTWMSSNTGFTERFVTRMVFDRDAGRVYAGVRGARPDGGVFVAPSVRGPWTRLGEGIAGRQVLSMDRLDDRVFAGTDDGIYFRTTNGIVWTRIPTRIAGAEAHPRVTELLVLPSGPLLAATTKGLIATPDVGRSWTRPVLGNSSEVFALATTPGVAGSGEGATVVAATRDGFWRSADAGGTWKQVGAPIANATPHQLAYLPGERPVLFVTTSGGLYRSGDHGATWQAVGGGIPRADLTGLAVHRDGKQIFASDFTHGGIFHSADGGETWQRMATPGLPSDRVWMLALDPDRPDVLLAASGGGGLHLVRTNSIPGALGKLETGKPYDAAAAGGAPSGAPVTAETADSRHDAPQRY